MIDSHFENDSSAASSGKNNQTTSRMQRARRIPKRLKRRAMPAIRSSRPHRNRKRQGAAREPYLG